MHQSNAHIECIYTYTYNKLKPKGTPEWIPQRVHIIVCYSVYMGVGFISCRCEVCDGIVADNSLVGAGTTQIKGTLVY